jgi:hypothetical protein
MTRVTTTLEANNNVRFLSQEVNNLALALIAPLGANQNCIHDQYYTIPTPQNASAPTYPQKLQMTRV